MAKKQKVSSKKKRATYRVRNWSQYNRSLVKRGSITLWISQEVIDNWHPDAPKQRSRGGQYQYSAKALECILLIKAVYHLPYRQSVGFTQSVMDLLGANVTVPDYSTVCKRSREHSIANLGISDCDAPKHIVMDSSGLKVYGEGEWKVRQHGYSKRRTWRKIHLSVNSATQEIEAVDLTEANVDDAEAGMILLTLSPIMTWFYTPSWVFLLSKRLMRWGDAVKDNAPKKRLIATMKRTLSSFSNSVNS